MVTVHVVSQHPSESVAVKMYVPSSGTGPSVRTLRSATQNPSVWKSNAAGLSKLAQPYWYGGPLGRDFHLWLAKPLAHVPDTNAVNRIRVCWKG